MLRAHVWSAEAATVKKLTSTIASGGLVVLTFAMGVFGGFALVVLAQDLHLT